MPKATRTAITQAQKRALRQWARSCEKTPSQKDCIAWFQEQFNSLISQTTVSKCLGTTYDWLDNPPSTTNKDNSARNRQSHWPELEQILFNWQQLIQAKSGLVTGDLLIAKAYEIWHALPQYKDLPKPKFSNGWLQKFKARYKIKFFTQHGEAGSVPQEAEEDMKALRTIVGEYEEDNIYNMDETGLYWKRTTSKGLATAATPGIKKEKARVTLVTCCNASGSDKVPIWFIGSAKTPRALRGVNIQALGGHWTSNKKAWMNGVIMADWLKAFYQYVGSTRQILLFLDNCSSHATGLELAPAPVNIRIQFLPANSTSRFQPLDQGIIQNLKVYYRKQWLLFLLEAFENNVNPVSTVTILHTVRWVIRAWNFDVQSSTIYACFRKSTLFQMPINLPAPPAPNITSLYHDVERAGQIRDLMSLENFLNPIEERETEL